MVFDLATGDLLLKADGCQLVSAKRVVVFEWKDEKISQPP